MLRKLVLIFILIILGLARKTGCHDKIKRVDSKKTTISRGIRKKLSIVINDFTTTVFLFQKSTQSTRADIFTGLMMKQLKDR